MSYCSYCEKLPADNIHVIYHNTQYGFPLYTDDELFGRLVLEIFQAGLSWEIILKKATNFQLAFDNFRISKVADYGDQKIEELLQNQGIIRNRLKIKSVIHNAGRILELQKEFGSFENWLDLQLGKTKEEWVKTFKQSFKFVGGEILNEFLMSTSYLRGAHSEKCVIFSKILELEPKWAKIV
ncbi:MAG: DNA-3-methyladenine glycosylase I [Bacteroidetes bacterium]|nr:DNA-3-methyladenine glycosylase I [Bacteroidota bacterium]